PDILFAEVNIIISGEVSHRFFIISAISSIDLVSPPPIYISTYGIFYRSRFGLCSIHHRYNFFRPFAETHTLGVEIDIVAFSYQKLAKYTGNRYGITLAADLYE